MNAYIFSTLFQLTKNVNFFNNSRISLQTLPNKGLLDCSTRLFQKEKDKTMKGEDKDFHLFHQTKYLNVNEKEKKGNEIDTIIAREYSNEPVTRYKSKGTT